MLKVTKEGNDVTIFFPEILGFALRREFKQATAGVHPGAKYILDFREVTHIDSSALGMLLMLRESAGGEKSEITFINLRPEAWQLLKLANFEKLFKFK